MENLHLYVNDYNKFADIVKAELMDKLNAYPEIREYRDTISRFNYLEKLFTEVQNG